MSPPPPAATAQFAPEPDLAHTPPAQPAFSSAQLVDRSAELATGAIPRPSAHVPLLADEIDANVQAWLDAQCAMIDGTMHGIVLKHAGNTVEYPLLARWPDHSQASPTVLVESAITALNGETPIITSKDDRDGDMGNCIVAMPVKTKNGAAFVAAFELPASVRRQQRAILQLLQWGAVWFDLLQSQRPAAPTDRLTHVVEMLASSLEHTEFEAAATTAVTELATRLGCTRVSLGLMHGRYIKVCAISNSARIDTRSNLVRDISAAMEEAVDQAATIAYPPMNDTDSQVSFAQEVLARASGGSSVVSTPMYDGSEPIGALTLEREGDDGFDLTTTEMCEAFASLLGPVVTLKKERERSLFYKAYVSFKGLAGRLFGPKHLSLKLYSIACIVVVALLATATGDYRVTSTARLEGSVKRIVTAPREGFIESAMVRAGDRVEKGQVLAHLDARELELERTKLTSQHEQLNKEHRAAATSHDRSGAAVLSARKKQTVAQLALIDEQLKRSRLVSPFTGIVVSGDLSQKLGSPVEHGQVLFEIAPLDTYRVVLEVDERDIGDLNNSQHGTLTLTGLPDTTLPFTVQRLTPMSTAREGRNFFEVHASLDATPTAVRPGMEGIGKVQVDHRKLIWIWTRDLVNWFRLSMWAWTG